MPTNGQFAVGELVTSADANTLFVRGYGNRIINGNFEINQRYYTSGTNLASGSYGFDRWKSGYTNTALTFTDGVQNTTVTISSSGVLQQIIERENMPAGTYILSWFGTATGRVYNSGGTPPSYAASPITVTLDGSANVVVEFTASGGTRTLGLVQLEAGTVFSPFQYRLRSEEIALCQRYYFRVSANTSVTTTARLSPLGFQTATTSSNFPFYFPQKMRAVPTISGADAQVSDDVSFANVLFTLTMFSESTESTSIAVTHAAVGAQFRPILIRAGNNSAFIAFSAEL
jgi:hypothetical protein